MTGPKPGQRFAVIPAAILDDDRLKARELLVLIALCRHADAEGVCWPSLATLCRTSRLSARTVQDALNVLEGIGVVERSERARKDGGDTSNLYRLLSTPPRKRRGGGTADLAGDPPQTSRGQEEKEQKEVSSSSKEEEPGALPVLNGRASRTTGRSAVASIEGLRNWAERMGVVQDPTDDVDYVRSAMRALVEDAKDVPRPLYAELTEIGVAAWEQRNREARQPNDPTAERYG